MVPKPDATAWLRAPTKASHSSRNSGLEYWVVRFYHEVRCVVLSCYIRIAAASNMHYAAAM
jgi:hypothetical protein